MKKKGLLICVEGVDQSGKKTQVGLLIKRLKEKGLQVEETSFPDYNTPIGKEIQAFLNGNREYNVHVRHILYAANRWERKKGLVEWLNKKRLVIVNRYSPSNLAYGLANGLNLEWLLNLEKGLPEADLIIVLDASPEVSFKRKSVAASESSMSQVQSTTFWMIWSRSREDRIYVLILKNCSTLVKSY